MWVEILKIMRPATAGILGLMLFLTGGSASANDGPEKPSETDEIVCSLPGVLSMVTYRGKKGEVWSCGGGNWCGHLPDRPGVCGLDPKSKANLDKFLGDWEYAWGNCEKRVWFQHKHKSALSIRENEVAYFNELEPLGNGRIIKVTRTDKGIDIETILKGEGRFLSIWLKEVVKDYGVPDQDSVQDTEIYGFGVGKTLSESRVERCEVERFRSTSRHP